MAPLFFLFLTTLDIQMLDNINPADEGNIKRMAEKNAAGMKFPA